MRLFLLVMVATFSLSTGADAGPISGTYVGSAPNLVAMLQLVDAGDGKLVGHYQEIKLVAGPKLDVVNATVSGNADQNSVVLSMASNEPVSERFVLSGTLSDGVLNLTGGGGGRSIGLRLTTASKERFSSLKSGLSKRLELMQAASDIDASKKRLETIVSRMSAYNMRADGNIQTIPATEEHIRQLTRRMGAALARLQSIAPSDNTAVSRGQIDVSINQGAVQASQLHAGLQSKRSEFQRTSSSLLKDAGNLLEKCRNVPEGEEEFTASIPAWNALCSKAPEIVSTFQKKAGATLKAFEHAEVVWQTEHLKQQSIIRSSDLASR